MTKVSLELDDALNTQLKQACVDRFGGRTHGMQQGLIREALKVYLNPNLVPVKIAPAEDVTPAPDRMLGDDDLKKIHDAREEYLREYSDGRLKMDDSTCPFPVNKHFICETCGSKFAAIPVPIGKKFCPFCGEMTARLLNADEPHIYADQHEIQNELFVGTVNKLLEKGISDPTKIHDETGYNLKHIKKYLAKIESKKAELAEVKAEWDKGMHVAEGIAESLCTTTERVIRNLNDLGLKPEPEVIEPEPKTEEEISESQKKERYLVSLVQKNKNLGIPEMRDILKDARSNGLIPKRYFPSIWGERIHASALLDAKIIDENGNWIPVSEGEQEAAVLESREDAPQGAQEKIKLSENPEAIKTIIRMHKENAKASEISKQIGYEEASINYWIKLFREGKIDENGEKAKNGNVEEAKI